MNLDLKNTGTTYWTWINFMIYWIWTWKVLNYLTGLELILSLGLGLEKCSNTVYDILDLDLRNTQHKEYLTELGLILLNTALELINQPSMDVVTKVWRLSWINCFLPFNIHAAFTALSFGDLCMMISPSALLRFLCSSGYCMPLSHMSVRHLECFSIL